MKRLLFFLFVAITIADSFCKEDSKDKPDVGTVIGIDLGMYRSFVWKIDYI